MTDMPILLIISGVIISILMICLVLISIFAFLKNKKNKELYKDFINEKNNFLMESLSLKDENELLKSKILKYQNRMEKVQKYFYSQNEEINSLKEKNAKLESNLISLQQSNEEKIKLIENPNRIIVEQFKKENEILRKENNNLRETQLINSDDEDIKINDAVKEIKEANNKIMQSLLNENDDLKNKNEEQNKLLVVLNENITSLGNELKNEKQKNKVMWSDHPLEQTKILDPNKEIKTNGIFSSLKNKVTKANYSSEKNP